MRNLGNWGMTEDAKLTRAIQRQAELEKNQPSVVRITKISNKWLVERGWQLNGVLYWSILADGFASRHEAEQYAANH